MELNSFHILTVAKAKVLFNYYLKCDHDPANDKINPPSFSIDGETLSLQEYVNTWISQVLGAAVGSFRSDTAPEGTYSLPFEDTRKFDSQTCVLNNEAIAKMVISGLLDVGVTRASVVESRFDFENRGRVYHAVSRGPSHPRDQDSSVNDARPAACRNPQWKRLDVYQSDSIVYST